jgi:ribosome-associated heat shock protein Hsp15
MPSAPLLAMRLDVWLWAARFFKTRSLAKQAIDGGKILVNAQPCKAAKSIKANDLLRISRGVETITVSVLALSEQRGSASVAQTLYQETPDSAAHRQQQAELHRLDRMRYQAPLKKPDKRQRRITAAFNQTLSE